MPARRTEKSASDRPRHQLVNWRRSQGVRLPGKTAVPSQETSEGETFGIVEGGLDRGERSGWDGSGHRAPPGRAGTGEAGPVPAPAVKRKPNVWRPSLSRHVTTSGRQEHVRLFKKCSRSRLCPAAAGGL